MSGSQAPGPRQGLDSESWASSACQMLKTVAIKWNLWSEDGEVTAFTLHGRTAPSVGSPGKGAWLPATLRNQARFGKATPYGDC